MEPVMPTHPVVHTVVVTFNRKDLLRDCLRANLDQDRPPDRLVLIDNASSDGTPQMLEQEGWLANERLLYRRLESNLGGAGGFRIGVEEALAHGAEWIWLMDDDAIPEPDALRQLLTRIDPSQPPALLASQVLTAAGEIDIAHRSRVRHRSLWTHHIPAREYAQELIAADMVSFVGPLIHRQHAETCGLPRADYFLYYDDHEFTHRVRRAGFPLWVVPGSRIRHLDQGRSLRHAMREQSWGWRMYYRVRNRVHWYRSIEPEALSLLWRLMLLFAVQWGLILLRQPHKLHRSLLMFRAFSDGWQARLGKTIDPATYEE